MDASVFWEIIGRYNQATWVIQLVLLVVLLGGVILTVVLKKGWICKAVLSLLNLFIGIAFFATYGTQPIQKFFALPLYLLAGVFFAIEAFRNKDDEIGKPDIVASILCILYLAYPLVSVMFGASFPQMVTHIMPCPVVTISIALYSCYKRKNPILLLLLTIWGLTGVKSVIFKAYEDVILLMAGIYGVALLFKMRKKSVES